MWPGPRKTLGRVSRDVKALYNALQSAQSRVGGRRSDNGTTTLTRRRDIGSPDGGFWVGSGCATRHRQGGRAALCSFPAGMQAFR